MSRPLTYEQKVAVNRILDLCAFWQIDQQTLEQHLPRCLSPEQLAAVKTIQNLCDYWGIDAEMIQAAPPAAAPTTDRIKYRHPRTGETWSGEGAQPGWLRHALLKEGFTVEELRPAPLPETA